LLHQSKSDFVLETSFLFVAATQEEIAHTKPEAGKNNCHFYPC
jgi:hypothetical protein